MEQTTEDVFSYITREENEFKNGPGVPVIDGWDFKFFEHIRSSTLYKYGQLAGRAKTENDPVINIILPILNVAYRSEDIDLKEVELYVDEEENDHKSLLARKFHEKWARDDEFDMDNFLDKLKESWHDYGLVLVKKGRGKPEVVSLQRLAFCDQTDILSGPICEKHTFSPEQLLKMKGRWDDDAIDEVIALARSEKAQQQVKGTKQKTPNKYVEVYELHGSFPESWDLKIDNPDEDKYTNQIHIITYYQGEKPSERKGIALFQGPEKENIYDALKRDEIYGRACGYGGVEEIIEPQVWHTYSAMQKKEMLDKAALMIVKTTDPGLARRQKITDLEKGEMLELEDGKIAEQLVLTPINWQVFDQWQEQMKLQAQTQGSANDPQLGVEPKAGTPFALQRLTTVQGQGIHEYRKGIMATFIRKLYRKWFLKDIVNEMNKGHKWLDEINLDDLQWVASRIAANWAEQRKKDIILGGRRASLQEVEAEKEKIKKGWLEGGSKRFFEIIKDEFADIPIDVKVNVAGKQKNLDLVNSKIIDLMRAIVGNPGLLLNQGFAKLMNQVIQYAGLDPVDFSGIAKESLLAMQNQRIQPATEPQQQLLAAAQQ